MADQTTMPPCSHCHAPYEAHVYGRCPYTLNRQPNQNAHDFMKVILVMLGIVVFLVAAWYVDTHCTEVLGTQVCQN